MNCRCWFPAALSTTYLSGAMFIDASDFLYKIECFSISSVDSGMNSGFFKLVSISPSLILLLFLTDIVSNLQHSSLMIITHSRKQLDNMIPTMRSKSQPPITTSYRTQNYLEWMGTVPDMTKVTRKRQFIKVGSPHFLLQTNHVHQNFFLCLPLTLFL